MVGVKELLLDAHVDVMNLENKNKNEYETPRDIAIIRGISRDCEYAQESATHISITNS